MVREEDKQKTEELTEKVIIQEVEIGLPLLNEKLNILDNKLSKLIDLCNKTR